MTGSSSLGITLGQLHEEDVKNAIQDLLEGLSLLGNKLLIVIDEFQKISEIDDKGFATVCKNLTKSVIIYPNE